MLQCPGQLSFKYNTAKENKVIATRPVFTITSSSDLRLFRFRTLQAIRSKDNQAVVVALSRLIVCKGEYLNDNDVVCLMLSWLGMFWRN